MPLEFATETQAHTYDKVKDYLNKSNLFKDTMRTAADEPRFHLTYGSAHVDVEILDWEVHPWEERELTIVKAWSCVTIGSQMSAELMEFLLNENHRMRFGAFQLGKQGEIFFAHSVLGGESMDLMELQTCILSVVTIADTYDDLITQKFGGQRACDRPLD
ncbi:T3SS (YopN, CesT) and YbjN peptide-binding chaperone 1 [Leptolyngbya sp. AN02str]|uniref:T3SS (YopN, CesT) and YbjN peptide-binding chaperone 1 n=1 Tax=Leptolyngbya sp. AN02str TaxID=3423363 RepID=UPI003D311205